MEEKSKIVLLKRALEVVNRPCVHPSLPAENNISFKMEMLRD